MYIPRPFLGRGAHRPYRNEFVFFPVYVILSGGKNPEKTIFTQEEDDDCAVQASNQHVF